MTGGHFEPASKFHEIPTGTSKYSSSAEHRKDQTNPKR